MKLVRQLTLTLVLAITAILAVHGYIEIRREIEHYETDMREDQRSVTSPPPGSSQQALNVDSSSSGAQTPIHTFRGSSRIIRCSGPKDLFMFSGLLVRFVIVPHLASPHAKGLRSGRHLPSEGADLSMAVALSALADTRAHAAP